ncbi:MAG: DUF1858 domain-containing protein, partial [Candidatus Pacearchaeota archaeon]
TTIKKKTNVKVNSKVKSSITKQMTFSEIMQKHPEAMMFLMEKGMHCCACHMAAQETLEEGCIAHGLNPDEIVKELNK